MSWKNQSHRSESTLAVLSVGWLCDHRWDRAQESSRWRAGLADLEAVVKLKENNHRQSMAQLQKFHSVRELEAREKDLRHSHTGRKLNLQLEHSEGLARFIQLRSNGCVSLCLAMIE